MKKLLLSVLLLAACHAHYGISGISLTHGEQTISIALFDARAPLCTARNAQTFTETLRDLMQAQTPLSMVRADGDIRYEGTITGFDVQPVAIQASETAAMNRLTISVSVHYTNTKAPKESADITAARFSDFPSTQDLATVQDQLVSDISKQLAQDIFDKTLGNW